MNFKLIKTISLASALAFSAAAAQDDEEEESSVEETTEETVAEAPAAPAVEEDEAPAQETKEVAEEAAPAPAANGLFNVLHGNAYNMVGSEAGASTIGGNMASPYKMYGSNLLYVEPSGENGTLAVTKGGMTYLLGFNNQYDMGMVTAGVAFKGVGLALDLALDKTWESTEAGDDEEDVSTTAAGDIINLKFGMLLGAFDLTANAYWLTFNDEVDTETDNAEEDNDYWDIGVNVAISNGPSAKNMFWSVGLNFLRQSSTTETTVGNTSTEVTHNDAYTMIQPFFNFALPVLSSENAQVFLGTNTRLPIYLYDEIKDGDAKDNVTTFGLYTAPNILGELSVSENWILFAGATYNWKLIGYRSEEIKGNATVDNSEITMKTYRTSANAGARFQYKNLILEASVADNLGSAAWSGMIANLGAFITF
ncbi:MAG: hypothetical protein MJZ26_13470 [Fibrobacter sp.]|nr:hypothetical protein [Fibrobacter sp.]